MLELGDDGRVRPGMRARRAFGRSLDERRLGARLKVRCPSDVSVDPARVATIERHKMRRDQVGLEAFVHERMGRPSSRRARRGRRLQLDETRLQRPLALRIRLGRDEPR